MHTPTLKNFLLGSLLGLHSLAPAAVLTFDDLPTGANWFVADYGGFTFGTNDSATTAWFHTDVADPGYTAASGSTYIATDVTIHSGALLETTQAIRSAADFVFEGAYFSGFDTVRYDLYLDDVLVHSSAESAVLSSVSRFVASGYGGRIDAVVVRGSQGFFALDDFTYNRTFSVPEPSGLALALMAGLVGAAASRRPRQAP